MVGTKTLKLFKNKFVLFTLVNEISSFNEDEARIVPLSVKGYLMDEDDSNFFLSDDGKTVSFLIHKDHYSMIELVKEVDVDDVDSLIDTF